MPPKTDTEPAGMFSYPGAHVQFVGAAGGGYVVVSAPIFPKIPSPDPEVLSREVRLLALAVPVGAAARTHAGGWHRPTHELSTFPILGVEYSVSRGRWHYRMQVERAPGLSRLKSLIERLRGDASLMWEPAGPGGFALRVEKLHVYDPQSKRLEKRYKGRHDEAALARALQGSSRVKTLSEVLAESRGPSQDVNVIVEVFGGAVSVPLQRGPEIEVIPPRPAPPRKPGPKPRPEPKPDTDG